MSLFRAPLTHTVFDRFGDVVQNAAVFAYQPGTQIDPLGTMYDDPVAGNILTNPLISDELGQVMAWSDVPQSVDLLVTTNGGTAFVATDPTNLANFPDTLKPWRGFYPLPEDLGAGGGGGGIVLSPSVVAEQVWGLPAAKGSTGTASDGGHTHGTPIGWQQVTFVIALLAGKYTAVHPDTGEVAFSGTSFGTIVNSAMGHALMANGGVIAVAPGAYPVANGISYSGGKYLVGLGMMKEGSSTGVRLTAAAGLGATPVVTIDGSGAGLSGLQVDAGAIGSSAVSMGAAAAGCTVQNGYLLGGTTNTLKLQTGASRCNFLALRIDGNSTPSDAVVSQIGSDHLFSNCRIVSPKSGAYTLHINGSFCQWDNCHIAGNATCLETILIDQAIRNIFANCEFDTGPNGTGALVHIWTGSDNSFVGCKFYNCSNVGSPAILLQKKGSGDSVKRNIFSGCTFEGGGANWQYMVKILNEAGVIPGDLSSFAGTQIVSCSGTGVAGFSNWHPFVNNVDQVVVRDLVITGGFTTVITAATAAATVGTITTGAASGVQVGMYVTISGVTPSGFNGTWKVLSVISSTQFTVQLATTPAAGSVFGTVAPAAQMSNGNGVAHLSGDGAATDFDVPHPLGMIPEMVVASAVSVDADSGRWRYSKANSTPTTLRLHCSTAPPNGPGQNVDVAWIASGVS